MKWGHTFTLNSDTANFCYSRISRILDMWLTCTRPQYLLLLLLLLTQVLSELALLLHNLEGSSILWVVFRMDQVTYAWSILQTFFRYCTYWHRLPILLSPVAPYTLNKNNKDDFHDLITKLTLVKWAKSSPQGTSLFTIWSSTISGSGDLKFWLLLFSMRGCLMFDLMWPYSFHVNGLVVHCVIIVKLNVVDARGPVNVCQLESNPGTIIFQCLLKNDHHHR